MIIFNKNKKIYLYNYNNKILKVLYTIEKQKELSINKNEYDDINNKYDYDKYSYMKHISFFIDPIPLDIVRKYFTNNETYQKYDYLYEHKINLYDINLLYYKFVENNIDNFFVKYISGIKFIKDSLYFNSKNILNNLVGYNGNDFDELKKIILNNKGVTRKSFEKIVNSDDFTDKYKRMYAPLVPHLFIYPKDGIIKIDNVKKVYFL